MRIASLRTRPEIWSRTLSMEEAAAAMGEYLKSGEAVILPDVPVPDNRIVDQQTKYAADIVIDGETFSNVTFSTKGFSSLYFVAYGEEESRRYSFKVNFGKLVEGQTYYGLDKLSGE